MITEDPSHGTRRAMRRGARARFRANRSGYTLVEVMASLFVIVTALFPALLLYFSSYRVSQQAQAQAIAYNIARRQLETIRAQQWANRVPSGTTTPISFILPSTASSQVFATGSGRQMQGTYTVTAVSSTLQQVSVCITWPSLIAAGTTSEVCLDTYLTK